MVSIWRERSGLTIAMRDTKGETYLMNSLTGANDELTPFPRSGVQDSGHYISSHLVFLSGLSLRFLWIGL
jgi:hypothetical protein